LSDACTQKNPNPAAQRKAILALLRAGADVGETDKNGVTPLHHAVRFRSVAAVKALVESGANVNQVCKRSGSTPLHRAVTSTGAPTTAGKQDEAKEIIELLLAAGADPRIKNKSGKRAVDYAREEGVRKMLEKS
jgi:tankyrase